MRFDWNRLVAYAILALVLIGVGGEVYLNVRPVREAPEYYGQVEPLTPAERVLVGLLGRTLDGAYTCPFCRWEGGQPFVGRHEPGCAFAESVAALLEMTDGRYPSALRYGRGREGGAR